jgi:NAD(P)-dependent dehydrogenase (short-subunit alcohol dehydrogenase family)
MGVHDYKQMFDLTGKVALVTGGGRGIGYAIAEGLGAWGARIAIAELDPGRCGGAAKRLRDQGIDAVGLPCDITDRSALKDMLDAVEFELGPIDILVNNAGISDRIAAEDYPDDKFDFMVELNLGALFRLTRDVAKRWIDGGRPGRVVNLASFAGLVADPMSAPYAATKGAVVQLTRTWAVEWAQHGILVNAIAPGYVRTEMTAHTLDSPEAGRVIRAKTALGRAGDTSEMVGAVVYLASPAGSYTTGHILAVDGGWTAM